MKSVRWGLLSTANINRKVIPAIRESSRGELVAVASRYPEKAADYARKWEIPRSFGSYQDMLKSGEIDAVYISLPNHLHAEWTIKSLLAGIHVLCEKPFATSLDDVDGMISASQKSGKKLCEAFMYRHHPQTHRVGEWIHSGKLGEITMIRGAFHILDPAMQKHPDLLDVRLVQEYDGGSLWDLGVYPISYAQFLLGGPPDRVFGSQQLGETGVDEVFAGQLLYSQGSGREVPVQISCSFKAHFNTAIEIIGTEGTIYLNRPFANLDQEARMQFTDNKGEIRNIPVPDKPLYLGEIEDLEAAILDNGKPLISLEETRNHVRTALALYESARTGKFIELDQIT